MSRDFPARECFRLSGYRSFAVRTTMTSAPAGRAWFAPPGRPAAPPPTLLPQRFLIAAVQCHHPTGRAGHGAGGAIAGATGRRRCPGFYQRRGL